MSPEIAVHVLPPSHPCMTVEAALKLKGLEYERVVLEAGPHGDAMEAIYGPEGRTVPGMTIDGEPVHGSRAILARLEAMVAEPPLFPADRRDAVVEAEAWGDAELQDLGRRLPWGALHFRPEALGTFGGGAPLDGPGTDFAMRYVRASWKYHGITAARLAEDLAGVAAKLDHVDALIGDGVMGDTAAPNAADLQIGATLRVLLTVGDLREEFAGRPGEALARALFPEYPGLVPAGAFPAGWVPARTA
jgi:glutathione S-transferase